MIHFRHVGIRRVALVALSAFTLVGFIRPQIASAATTHYVAANGSDSNNGTSKSTPWQHAPGMPNCTASCASYSPNPGDRVVLRGGDTWHFGNSNANPYTGGKWNIGKWWGTDSSCIYESTQTGCIYYGVDQTWYTGTSWARPILTADNPTSTSNVTNCAYQVAGDSNVLISMGVATILDNVELTGMCSKDVNVTPGIMDVYINYSGSGTAGTGTAFSQNIYIHGWTQTSAAGSGSATGAGTIIGGGYNGLQVLDHIVVDGSDSNPGAWMWGQYPSFYHFRDSIIRHTSDGVGQWCHDIHDNIFEFIVPIQSGGHTNILECNDDNSGNAGNQPQNTPNVVYNNIVRHSSSNVDLWFCPETVPEYWFNNLMYDTDGEGWSYAGPPTYGCPNTGGQFMFNNTLVDVLNQPCSMGGYVGHGGQYLTVYNEHLINTPFDTGSTPCTGVNSPTNVKMSDSTATTQGYTTGSPGTYLSNNCANDGTTPCAPTAAKSGTVGAGANHMNDYCAALASYSSEYAISTEAASACKYGTTDGCSYDSTSHSMTCPAETAVARPASGVWDSGAYEYDLQDPPPAPPSGLNAQVQ